MAKWAEIKCPRCEELEAEIDFLNAQLAAMAGNGTAAR
jgi:phage FluMu protein Com